MKKKLILIISLCLYQLISSQTDFRKGYIITTTSESINGLVNYREGYRSFTHCDFKKSEDQDVITYTTDQIKGYGFINDKYYEVKEILNEINNKQRFFLEVLIKGNATLYKFRNRFFIEKNETIFKELTNEEKDVLVNDKQLKRKSNRHIGTLLYLFSDCPELKEKIETLFLGEKSLTDLVELYNDCGDLPSITFKEKKAWLKTIVGVSAGFNSSSINFDDALENQGFFTTELGTANSIMFGAFIDISSPRVYERLSFHGGVFYLSATHKANQLDVSSLYTYRNYVTTELEQIKIPIGFRYSFPEKKITPYFTVGISNNFNLKSISKWTEEREANNIVETFEDTFDLTNIRLGYWGSVGVKKTISNKLTGFVETRFDYSIGFPQTDQHETIRYFIPSVQFLIGLSI